MESFLYNFKYWVALRRGSLPLSTSKRCIPTIASLWNRSKNGSDVATGIMRGSWYPLPTASRTPSALVVQRILFLTTINIMKIATFLTFKNQDGEFEDIDKFRNRTNKIFGSHRAFLLHVRKRCIVPMMRSEEARTQYALDHVNNDSIPNPTTPMPHNCESEDNEPCRRQTRSISKTTYIPEVHESLQITGTTPSTRNKNIEDLDTRVLNCSNPCLARTTGNGKKCIRCKRITKMFCLGCHQHMCMTVAKDADINKQAPQRFQESITAYDVCLGKRKARIQLDTFTKSGNRQRKTVYKDVELNIQGTCYNILHKHVLERQGNGQTNT